MTSGNIVEFPKSKIIRDASLNIEAIEKMKEKSTQNFADTLVQDLTESLLTELDNYGIDIEDEVFAKDFFYMVSIMSAMIYRTLNLKHDFHDFLDKNVVMKEEPMPIDMTE